MRLIKEMALYGNNEPKSQTGECPDCKKLNLFVYVRDKNPKQPNCGCEVWECSGCGHKAYFRCQKCRDILKELKNLDFK